MADIDVSGVYVDRLIFNDDTEIPLSENSILLITGPNNCGKSQILKDLSRSLRDRVVLSDIDFRFKGEMADILTELAYTRFDEPNDDYVQSMLTNWSGDFAEFCDYVEEEHGAVDRLFRICMQYVPTSSRTEGISPGNDDIDGYGNAFIFQAIHESRSLERKLHDLIKSVFGVGIVTNRESYRDKSLRFISSNELDSMTDRGEASFARWLEAQPALEEQGDGIRAFCTIILTILTQIRPLIVIDEPEAFLHPPQARRLARAIALETPPNTQVIIATHSNDFVQGLLDFANSRVNVVRVMRKSKDKETINAVSQLNAEEIAEFWRDPLLKTSDALSSLFHDVAIIVEGDSDARFFRAMLDAIYRESSEYLPDIRFFHCGGKDRIPKIASALRSAGLPVLSMVDIDILDNKSKFYELYRAFNGNTADIDAHFVRLQQFVASKRSPLIAAEAKKQIEAIFSDLDLGQPLSSAKAGEIGEVVQSFSAWRYIKSNGEHFFTGGEPYNNFTYLRQKSEGQGILINRHGELENLCRTITPRKSEWLATVLQKDLLNDPELHNAREMTKHLVETCRKILA